MATMAAPSTIEAILIAGKFCDSIAHANKDNVIELFNPQQITKDLRLLHQFAKFIPVNPQHRKLQALSDARIAERLILAVSLVLEGVSQHDKLQQVPAAALDGAYSLVGTLEIALHYRYSPVSTSMWPEHYISFMV